jgi:O-antigen/teichoic acid export membrane protein
MRSPDAVHVARGTSYVTLQTLITSAAQIVSFAVLARLITTKEMGILAVLNIVIGLCQTIAAPALQQAARRFIVEYLGQGKRRVAASVFYQSICAMLLIAVPFGRGIFLEASFCQFTC